MTFAYYTSYHKKSKECEGSFVAQCQLQKNPAYDNLVLER